MSEVKQSTRAYMQWLESIDYAQYIMLFGSVFSKIVRRQVPFKLWPGQEDLLRKILRDRRELLINLHWIPKARQLGVTEIASEMIIKDCQTYERFEALIISKTEPDALYMMSNRIIPKLKYYTNMVANMKKEGLIDASVEPVSWKQPKQNKIEFSNGSSITVLPASNTSGASMSADAVLQDEGGGFDLQNNASLEKIIKNVLPTIEKSRLIGWMLVVGTSEPGTYFNQKLSELWKLVDRVNAGMESVEGMSEMLYFLPYWVDPERTEAWVKKEKRRLGEVNFKQQYPANRQDFFSMKEGKVYPNFDDTPGGRHVREIDEIPWTWDIFELYDHGVTEQHKGAWCWGVANKRTKQVMVLGEKMWVDENVKTRAEYIIDQRARWPKPARIQIADTAIFNKTGISEANSVADVFKKYGVSWKKSKKYDEDGGREIVSDALERNALVFSIGCVCAIDQFENWRWHKNGLKPEDKENEFPDLIRYLYAEFGTAIPEAELQKMQKMRSMVEAEQKKMMRNTDKMLWRRVKEVKFNVTTPAQIRASYQGM